MFLMVTFDVELTFLLSLLKLLYDAKISNRKAYSIIQFVQYEILDNIQFFSSFIPMQIQCTIMSRDAPKLEII